MPRSLQIPAQISDVACPFCGLLCDDLTVENNGTGLKVLANGCALSRTGFERPLEQQSPRVGGKAASLDAAVTAAGAMLKQSRMPLISGLGTDVSGVRAAASLADRIGASLDHMNAPAGLRNLLVLQDGGWITTTLSEVRNRADLLVMVGSDIVSRFPRFFERCIANRETLFGENRACEIVLLGGPAPGDFNFPSQPTVIGCEVSRIHEGLGALRALIGGAVLNADAAGDVPMSTWNGLAQKLKSAKYGVMAWAAADFDFPHAELTVQTLAELIKDLNRETRFNGLPLGGSDGDITTDMVLLWQTGFAIRTGYGQGQAEHDPYHFAGDRLLQRGETDTVVWISSISPSRLPPAGSARLIVVGHPAMKLEREPEVFIPVGTPGVDHAGHLFRSDRVVALSMGQVRESGLPTVAEVLTAIEAQL